MKWCIEFPEETVLVIRPSLKRICLNISPAANLLSVLLYRHSIRKEASEDAMNLNSVKRGQGEKEDQDVSYRIYRKQSQIVTDCCGELTEKTLHDRAVPLLHLLGYLDVEENPGCNCYILHMNRINEGMIAYKKGTEALSAFYRSIPQLEVFLIENQIEISPIDRKKFQLGLEKLLIDNRKTSNCQRGPKGKPEATVEGEIPKGRLREDYNTDYKKEESIVVSATQNNAPIFHPLYNFIALDDSLTPKVLTVYLTSNEYSSEMEDKRRAFVAQEVKEDLARRGHEVTYKWEHEKEPVVVDAPIVSSTTENDQPALFPETAIPIVSDTEKPLPKARKSKKVLDLVPTLPPAKPLEDVPWSVEKCLAWGDYARKCVFPVSNHPQSKYYKSVEAAKKIIGQGITENTFLAVYLNWMKGVNTNLEALPESATRSETWGNYSVDLWVFIEHYEDEARKYRAKKSGQSFQASSTTPIDFTAQKEAARIKNLANIAKMEQIKAKIELEKQQAGKKKVAL